MSVTVDESKQNTVVRIFDLSWPEDSAHPFGIAVCVRNSANVEFMVMRLIVPRLRTKHSEDL